MPGLQGVELYWRESPTGLPDWPVKYECRSCVVIFGHLTGQEHMSPFDERFYGPYVRGVGMTKEIALKKLEEDFRNFHEGLWV